MTSSELKIREVRRSDEEEIVEMTSEIWDGQDYVPDHFDRWIEDGGFICGTVDGEIVALAKHTWHTDDILWLEGLRVHPDHQEEGYGRAMIEGQLEFMEDLDYSVARFLTSGDKTPVKKVVEDLGFEVKKIYDYLGLNEEDLEAMKSPSNEKMKRVKRESDEKEVTDFVLSSQELEENEGLYLEHWTAYPMDEQLIEDRVENGHCYSVRDKETGEIKALMFLQLHEDYDSLSATFACGSHEGMKALFDFGIKYCLEKEYDGFRLKTASESVINAAEDVGFSYSDHHPYTVVYEYEKN